MLRLTSGRARMGAGPAVPDACRGTCVRARPPRPRCAPCPQPRGQCRAPHIVSCDLPLRADTGGTADVLGLVTFLLRRGRPGAQVLILRSGRSSPATSTDRLGAYRLHGIADGRYDVWPGSRASAPGRPRRGTSDARAASPMCLRSSRRDPSAAIKVGRRRSRWTRARRPGLQAGRVPGEPALTTSQVVQQPSRVRRGPHGRGPHPRPARRDTFYYVDGVPGLRAFRAASTSCFDPSIVNQINFPDRPAGMRSTGAGDAAVINVTTRVPSGGFHASASSYLGNFGSDGQNAPPRARTPASSDCSSRARGRRPHAAGARRCPTPSAAGGVTAFGTTPNYGSGPVRLPARLQYTPTDPMWSASTRNWSRPGSDPLGFGAEPHRRLAARRETGLSTSGWQHRVSRGPDQARSCSERPSTAGSLTYSPGATGLASFTFAAGPQRANQHQRGAELRHLRGEAHYQPALRTLAIKGRHPVSVTRGREAFQSFDEAHVAGPRLDSAPRRQRPSGYTRNRRIRPPQISGQLRAGVRSTCTVSPARPRRPRA